MYIQQQWIINSRFSSILKDKIFNNMSKYLLPIIFIVTSLSIPSAAQSLGQQSEKVAQLKYCGSILKSQFISHAQQYRANTGIQNAIQSMFPADKNKLVQGVIEGNSGKFKQSVQGHEGKYVASIGILAFIALLHIILIPVLFATRCCTRCQKLKCKKSNESYSPCQLCWPGACILILLFALIGISAGILKVNRDFQPKYTDFKCSLGITTHNILQGGSYDKDKIQFMGLKNYRDVVDGLFNNLSAINTTIHTNLTKKSKQIKSLSQYIDVSFDLVSSIPGLRKQPIDISYSYPIDDRTSKYFPSIINSRVGTFNLNGSYVGNLTNRVYFINDTLKSILKATDNFDEALSRVDQQLVNKEISESIYKMQSVDFDIINTVGITEQGVLKAYTVGSYVVLGFTIFMAVVLCLGVICLAFWNSYPCKSRVLFCCGILWIIGILHFLLALAFTLANPAMLYGCQYAREGFASQTGFYKNFGDISSGSQASKIISKCLSSSKTPNYLYDNILTQGVKANLSQLHETFPVMLNATKQSEQFNGNFSQMLRDLQDYKTFKTYDIADTKILDQMKQYSIPHACINDSWVLSLNHTPPIVPCANYLNSSSMPHVTGDTCTSIQNLYNRSPGCVGCMDIYSLFTKLGLRYGLKTHVATLYDSCEAEEKQKFYNVLAWTWDQYIGPKQERIPEIVNSAARVRPNSNQMFNILSNHVDPNLKRVQHVLQTEPMLQPNSSGYAKQMDCRVLGRGIDDTVNIVCSEGIPYVYNLRFLYYTTAVLIFLICCISVCVASRFYHQHKLKSYAPDEGKDRQMKNIRLQHVPITDRRESVQEMVVNAHPYIEH